MYTKAAFFGCPRMRTQSYLLPTVIINLATWALLHVHFNGKRCVMRTSPGECYATNITWITK